MILPVKTSSGGYDIVLERGSIEKLNNYLNLERRVLIITDSGVPKEYSEEVLKQCDKGYIVTIPEGETSKNFDNYKMLLSKLVELGFTRTDCVVTVGGGVVGGRIARTLSAYQLRVCILEKAHDVAAGASSANSAIVHAGFDAKEGSLKAKLNVRGSLLMEGVCRELGVKYRNNGSLVIGFHEEERKVLGC